MPMQALPACTGNVGVASEGREGKDKGRRAVSVVHAYVMLCRSYQRKHRLAKGKGRSLFSVALPGNAEVAREGTEETTKTQG